MATSLFGQIQDQLGGSYTIEKELTGGGMARVFVARDEQLDRRVVVKVLPNELAGGVSLERFRRETQLVANLQHPNIVPVLTAGAMDGVPFFTMPFVQGESLADRLARDGRLPMELIVRVLRNVAAALQYAHAQGIIHRDIKPSNVLLSGDAAMVTDFGVSKAMGAATSHHEGDLTTVGMIIGTPAYMAPEQAAADPNIDHRADIYAFGVMAYELVCGRTPFANRTPQSMLAAHIHERPAPVVSVGSRVPPALADLIMACLEKDPARRPQSGAELERRLELSLPVRSPARGWLLRHRRARIGLAAALAAPVILLLLLVRPNDQATPSDSARQVIVTAPPVIDSGGARDTAVRDTGVRATVPTIAATATRPDTVRRAISVIPPTLRIDALSPQLGDTFVVNVSMNDIAERIIAGGGRLTFGSATPAIVRHVRDSLFVALQTGSAVLAGRVTDANGRVVAADSTAVRVRAPGVRLLTAPRDTTSNAELRRAITFQREFNVEASMPILRRLIAAEETLTRRDAAMAYQYLASAMALMNKRDSAVMLARAALARDPTLQLDPREFAATELAAFADAAVAYTILGIAPVQQWVFTPGREAATFTVGSAQRADVLVMLRRRVAGAAPFVIFQGAIEGQAAVPWDGLVGSEAAEGGEYELLAVAQGRYGAASDTARRSLEIRPVAGAGGVERLMVRPVTPQ